MTKFTSLAAGLFLAMAATQTASAITFVQPGFTDNIAATLPSNSGYGSMALDAAGNVYLTDGFLDQITKITPGGTTSILTTLGGTDSLALERVGNILYAGDSTGQVFSIDLTNPSPTATLLGTASGAITGLAFTGGSFGSFGGDLIIASNTGLQSMSITTGALTGFSRTGNFSDAIFDGSGRLFTAAVNSNGVQQISDVGGLVATLLTTTGNDGLAVSSATGDIYAANFTSKSITRIDGATFATSLFATGVAFDGGFYPSAMAFSNDGGSLYYFEEGEALHRIDGFSTEVAALPEPGMIAVLGFGLAGLGLMRRRQAA